MENGRKVSVSNNLIRAVQKLSLNEKRLVMLAIAHLDKHQGIEQVITINAHEYSSFYNIQKNNAYRTLKEAKKRLWHREFYMPEVEGGMYLRWIISYNYNKGQGSVSLKFHPDLDGYIVNLKERFTQYLLKRAADFKYLYSWRLFELILQFRHTGVLQISVDEFKEVMEIPEAYSRDFTIIRRKVINLAIDDIKERDGMDIQYKVKKTGRKITSLTFTFPVEQQTTLPLDPRTPEKNQLEKALELRAEINSFRSYADLQNKTLVEVLPPQLKEAYHVLNKQKAVA